jgi:hypothetical protein
LRLGSTFESWLDEQGLGEETTAVAQRKFVARYGAPFLAERAPPAPICGI